MQKKLNLFIWSLALSFVFSCGGNKEQPSEEEVTSEAETALKELSKGMGETDVSLSSDDIDKFIKTLEPMMKEFRELGLEVENDGGPEIANAFFASEKARDILEKYDWEEDFGKKYMIILMGYGLVQTEKQLQEMPEEQREQFSKIISSQTQQLSEMVSEDDLKLIREHFEEIKETVEKID